MPSNKYSGRLSPLPNRVWLNFGKLLLIASIPASTCATPQSQPVLQITAPSAKTIANPGQTLTVSVTSPTPAAFSAVDLYGDDPLGFVGSFSSLPGQTSVTIPASGIDCGSYFLTVSGTLASGQGPVSAIVELDVERPDFPLTISASLSPIIFDSAGEQIRLDLLAGFVDGTTLGVTASSYVTYSSSNTAVATVDPTGLVTAVAPGSGSITVTYALGSNNNQISIPVSVPNPVNTAPPAPTITNLGPSSGAVGTPVTITGTNFGGSQGTSTVTFNGTAATSGTWGATSIIAPVPSGTTTGNVVVTVGGVASNGANFTVQGTTGGIALVQHTSLDVAVSTSSSGSPENRSTASSGDSTGLASMNPSG